MYGGQGYGYQGSHQSYHPQQSYQSQPIRNSISNSSRHSHGGHHGRQSQYGPPPGGNPELWQWFTAVDYDRSGSISVDELHHALKNGNWTPFDLDTVKMLMNIFDTDRNGTISFNEFSGLFKYITDWQNVFKHFDRDRSGSIDGAELAEALRSFGYNLSPTLLMLVEQKYASGPAADRGSSGITFDRFVRACVVVKTLTDSFQQADVHRTGVVSLNYEQFMRMVLSAP